MAPTSAHNRPGAPSMNRRTLSLTVLPLASGGGMAAPAAAQKAGPRVFQFDGRALAKVKQRLAAGDKEVTAAVADLRGRADKELKAGPFSIVTNKKPKP